MKICSLCSGSSGNCIFVGSDNTKILVDAGMSGTKITNALKSIDVNPNELDGILVTHEHIDHIKGAGILSRKYDVPIYATDKTWEAMEDKIGEVSLKNVRQIYSDSDFCINDIDITANKIPHDAVDPVAYNLMNKGRKVGICTDLGYMPKTVYDSIKDCDVLLLESNHDIDMLNAGSYPFATKKRILGQKGHLSNETCGQILAHLADRVKYVMLGHLSKENNTPDLALSTIVSILKENGITEKDIFLEVLKRDKISRMYDVV